MKQKLKSILALVLCLCLSMSILSGCGGSETETTGVTKPKSTVAPTKPVPTKPNHTSAPTTAPSEPEDEMEAISAYYDNDETGMTLSFFDDYTFVSSTTDYQAEGTYFIIGNSFTLELDGDIVEGRLGADGKLFFDDDIGFYYEVDAPGYIPAGGPGEDDYLAACYDNDESEYSLDFYPDMKVYMTDDFSVRNGTYTLVDGELTMDFGDITLSGYVNIDDEIELYEMDGVFYRTDEVGYYPDVESSDTPVHISVDDIPTHGEKTTAYTDDDKFCYTDYDGKVSITYPQYMTNYEDVLGPGSVLLGDNMDGFVLGMNMTEQFYDYNGTHAELAEDLFDSGILSIFEILYGEYEYYDDIYVVPPEQETAPGRVISCETTVYNDDYSIRVIYILYENYSDGSGNGEFTLKCFYFPDGNDDQIDYLWNEVTDCISLPW